MTYHDDDMPGQLDPQDAAALLGVPARALDHDDDNR